jgi:hypothetical protein
MLNVAGCGKYTASQAEVCQCVPEDQVPIMREKAIEQFYAAYNPSVFDNAKALAQKATSKAKFATLMLKLVKKYYPDTIDVKDDPEKARMQEVVDEQMAKEEKKQKEEAENTQEL